MNPRSRLARWEDQALEKTTRVSIFADRASTNIPPLLRNQRGTLAVSCDFGKNWEVSCEPAVGTSAHAVGCMNYFPVAYSAESSG